MYTGSFKKGQCGSYGGGQEEESSTIVILVSTDPSCPSHLILVLQAEVAELVELLIGPALHEEPEVVLDEVHGEGRRGGRGGGAGRGQGGGAGQGETIRVPVKQAAGGGSVKMDYGRIASLSHPLPNHNHAA